MLFPPPDSPQLAAGERAIADAALGRESAVLTERRLIIAGRAAESSVALAHIARVAVRFERSPAAIVSGALLIGVAILLFAIATPMRIFFLAQVVALEPSVRQERANAGAEGGGIAQGMQRIMSGLARASRAMPLLAGLALVFGLLRIALGVLGRTVMCVGTGGGEFELARRGRQPLLEEFAREVGRHLPAAAA